MSMLSPGFEWFVAWRHLRDPERRSARLLKVGLALAVLSGLALGVLAIVGRRPHAIENASPVWTQPAITTAAVLGVAGTVARIALVLGLFLAFLGVLFAKFTVFTAISIFGVFLGTSA